MEWLAVLWPVKRHWPDEALRSATSSLCDLLSEELAKKGLSSKFNSLHAQREACLAYIESQKREGWIALAGPLDDGGISGGTLERPALQRLLRDIEAGLIDVVVVYKIDQVEPVSDRFRKLIECLSATT